jgi:large subunit ribosomal protein L10
MNRDEKAQAIEEIAAQIDGAEAIFAVDYRGISVPQAAELRGKLREADTSFRVVKNRLTKRAADQAGEQRLGELLQGPTALAFVRGDTAQAAKAISTFNKEHEVLTFKGGFMGELSLDEEKFKSIARLPAREVLDGQLAGVVASPLTGLVRGLGSMIQGLALQLGQIAEKGLVTGEAPGDSAAGPAAAGDPPPPAVAEASSEEVPPTASPADETEEDPPADGADSPEAGKADAPVEEPPTESSAENPTPEDPSPAEGEDEGEDDKASDSADDQSKEDEE